MIADEIALALVRDEEHARVSVSLFITQAQKATLRERSYTDQQIQT